MPQQRRTGVIVMKVKVLSPNDTIQLTSSLFDFGVCVYVLCVCVLLFVPVPFKVCVSTSSLMSHNTGTSLAV